MKKNTIKATVIGLSAIMTMSTPMTAMAAENITIDENNTNTVENENKEEVKVKDVENVKETADDLVNSGSVKETETKDESLIEEATKEYTSETVKNAAQELKTEITKEIVDSNGNVKEENKTTSDIKDVSSNLETAKEELTTENNKKKEAEKEVEKVEKIAEDTNKEIEESEKDIDKEIDNIKSSDDIKKAEESKKTIDKIVENTNKTVEDANKEIESAKAKYEKAKLDAETAEALYQTAVKNAGDKANTSVEDLKAAYEKAEELKNKAAAELETIVYTEQDKRALDIINKQKEIQAMTPYKWAHEDSLFKKIMNHYYIPEVMKNEIEKGYSLEMDKDFTRTKFSVDKEENYIKVNVKDQNGNVVNSKYLNYDLDETGKNLVIFEKTKGKKVVKEFDYLGNGNFHKYENGDSDAKYFSDATDENFNAYLENEADEKTKKKIISGQKEIRKNHKAYFHADGLFKTIMNNYYLPKVMNKGEGNTLKMDDNFTRFSDGKGEKNYIAVTETNADGKEVDKKYFNYEIDQSNGHLIIFEKNKVYKDVEKTVYLNDNYENYKKNGSKEGILLIEKTDEGLKNFLGRTTSIEEKRANHQNVVKKAEEAMISTNKAIDEVNKLKKEIEELKKKSTTTTAEFAEMNERLNSAIIKYNEAKKKSNELNNKVEVSQKELEKTVERLTPEESHPTVNTKETTNDNDNNTSTSQTIVNKKDNNKITENKTEKNNSNEIKSSKVTKKVTENKTEEKTTNKDTKVNKNLNKELSSEDLTNNENKDDALSGSNDINITSESTKPTEEESVVIIENEEVPLAETAEKENKEMSWWWILLLAILGATGYEIYKKHKENKEANEDSEE